MNARRLRARDPRSFLELRRLARRAQRSDEMREVLHDALLETFPSAYEKAITEARGFSENGLTAWNVWFFPSALNAVTRKNGTTGWLAFEIHRAYVERSDLRASRSRSSGTVNQALVIYETTPTKYLVYEDPEGHGHGTVVDRVTGHAMGHRLAGRRPFWSDSRRQSVGALNAAFLRWMRWRLQHHYTRDQIIDWLRWNDPNGAYTDEDAYREEQLPLTHGEAADLAFEHVVETRETLEEMRRNARR